MSDASSRKCAAPQDLLRHNCNHFSEEVAQFLCSKSIGGDILRVPELVMATPFGAMLAPMFDRIANEPSMPSMQREAAAYTSRSAVPAQTPSTPAPVAMVEPPPTPSQIATPATIAGQLPPAATPAPLSASALAAAETPFASAAETPLAAAVDTPATLSARPAATKPIPTPSTVVRPSTAVNGQMATPLATPAAKATPAGAAVGNGAGFQTPGFVTPAPNVQRPPPPFGMSLRPPTPALRSEGGATGPVLKKLLDSLDLTSCGLPPASRETLRLHLPPLLEPSNTLAPEGALEAVAAAAVALLASSATDSLFAPLYLLRLAAAAEPFAFALVEGDLVPTLLRGPLHPNAQTAASRPARLMALTLLSNAAASPAAASQIVRAEGLSTEEEGAVSAASRALASGDAPLAQIGGALAYNLALNWPIDEPGDAWARLLATALEALPTQTDGAAIARLLCSVGQLLLRIEDEALAVAISLDASTTLVARATEGSTAEGWQPLLAEVRALLE
jgi:hypothetical protein